MARSWASTMRCFMGCVFLSGRLAAPADAAAAKVRADTSSNELVLFIDCLLAGQKGAEETSLPPCCHTKDTEVTWFFRPIPALYRRLGCQSCDTLLFPSLWDSPIFRCPPGLLAGRFPPIRPAERSRMTG